MKRLFLSILCLFIWNSSVSAEGEYLEIPESIEYLEYCYNSGNCEVPYEVEAIIMHHQFLVKMGLGGLY